jgi:hypothetical protein
MPNYSSKSPIVVKVKAANSKAIDYAPPQKIDNLLNKNSFCKYHCAMSLDALDSMKKSFLESAITKRLRNKMLINASLG